MDKEAIAKRGNTLLKEYIQEAISRLDNELLANLNVSKIDGGKNKSDAKVFILKDNFDEKKVLSLLKKASGFIQRQGLISSGWVRFPRLLFYIDDSLEKHQKMDQLFEKIRQQ